MADAFISGLTSAGALSMGNEIVISQAPNTAYRTSLTSLWALLNSSTIATGGTAARTLADQFGEVLSVKDRGATGDGTTNDRAEIQAAIDYVSAAGGGVVEFPYGTYRINTPLTPKSNVMLRFSHSAILKQQDAYAIQQAAGVGLTRFYLVGATFQYSGSDAPLDCALALDAHEQCVFRDLKFTNYDNVGIIRRKATGAPGVNTTMNRYENWYIEKCVWCDWAQGLDTHYSEHTGNGVTLAFAVTWNFSWPGDVIAGLWKAATGAVQKLVLDTDFTVTGGGGTGAATTGTVTFAVAPSVGDIIMIWPRTAAGRTSPISTNVWREITCRRFKKYFHVGVRYIDSERFVFSHCQGIEDNARPFLLNPFSPGNAETDIYSIISCNLGYAEGLTESTISAIEFGPGSIGNYVHHMITDSAWSNLIRVTDNEERVLTGTVSVTNGSPTVTGVGTKFTKELSIIGGTADRIIVNGTQKGIASITSDTVLTTSNNWGFTASGVAATGANPSSHVSYDISNNNPVGGSDGRHSRMRRKSGSVQKGTAAIPGDSVTTTVTVEWTRLFRAPTVNEIVLTSLNSAAATARPFISSVGATSFVIGVVAASASAISIGWRIDLMDYLS